MSASAKLGQDDRPLLLVPRRVPKAWGEELWLNSTWGESPAGVAGGGTLAQVLRRQPRLLGAWSRRLFGDGLPVFAKILRTDFPPLAHIGFNSLVRPQEFLGWLCREVALLSALRRSLRAPDERAFRRFTKTYEAWATERALDGWQAAPERDRKFAAALGRFSKIERRELLQLCEDLRRNRQRIVGVLNLVDLRRESGNLLMIKAGLIHALFGLSLQFHPQDATLVALQDFILSARGRGRAAQKLRLARQRQEGAFAPKSEVWMPLPFERQLRLAEVQQSSDCTFSVADFFTPFIWERGARFRKGHPALGTSDASFRRLLGGLDFSVTSLASLRCRPQPSEPGPQAKSCRLWRLLDRPAVWPFFTVQVLDLAGTATAAARWVAPLAPAFQHVIVLSGKARIEYPGGTCRISAKAPAFVPARPAADWAISAGEPASLLLVSVPGPR